MDSFLNAEINLLNLISLTMLQPYLSLAIRLEKVTTSISLTIGILTQRRMKWWTTSSIKGTPCVYPYQKATAC